MFKNNSSLLLEFRVIWPRWDFQSRKWADVLTKILLICNRLLLKSLRGVFLTRSYRLNWDSLRCEKYIIINNVVILMHSIWKIFKIFLSDHRYLHFTTFCKFYNILQRTGRCKMNQALPSAVPIFLTGALSNPPKGTGNFMLVLKSNFPEFTLIRLAAFNVRMSSASWSKLKCVEKKSQSFCFVSIKVQFMKDRSSLNSVPKG